MPKRQNIFILLVALFLSSYVISNNNHISTSHYLPSYVFEGILFGPLDVIFIPDVTYNVGFYLWRPMLLKSLRWIIKIPKQSVTLLMPKWRPKICIHNYILFSLVSVTSEQKISIDRQNYSNLKNTRTIEKKT